MNPTCALCGAKCCKVLWLPGPPSEFTLRTRRVVEVLGGTLIAGRCRRLDNGNRCSVYEMRPALCREWDVDGLPCVTVRAKAGRVL